MYETYEETLRELSIISEALHESTDDSTLQGRHHLEEEKKYSFDSNDKPKGIYDNFIREEQNEDGSSMS
jgi:hypothetical protein